MWCFADRVTDPAIDTNQQCHHSQSFEGNYTCRYILFPPILPSSALKLTRACPSQEKTKEPRSIRRLNAGTPATHLRHHRVPRAPDPESPRETIKTFLGLYQQSTQSITINQWKDIAAYISHQASSDTSSLLRPHCRKPHQVELRPPRFSSPCFTRVSSLGPSGDDAVTLELLVFLAEKTETNVEELFKNGQGQRLIRPLAAWPMRSLLGFISTIASSTR